MRHRPRSHLNLGPGRRLIYHALGNWGRSGVSRSARPIPAVGSLYFRAAFPSPPLIMVSNPIRGARPMADRIAATLARTVRLAAHRVARPAPDAELLAAFVRSKDPAAFEGLVRRHGPLVLAACRAVLPDPADADDACQATFVVLHRKAHTVRDAGTLGGWLFR